MIQTGGMAQEKCGHGLDLDAQGLWWKSLSRFCVQAHSRGRWAVVRHEEIHLERLAGVDAVLVEIRDAFTGEESIINQKVPGEGLRLVENAACRLGQNLRLA